MKTIKETKWYTIFEDVFDGIVLTMRRWKDETNAVDIFFDDQFARANGYASTDDLMASAIGEQDKAEIISKCGSLPEWVRVMPDGKFYFVFETINYPGDA